MACPYTACQVLGLTVTEEGSHAGRRFCYNSPVWKFTKPSGTVPAIQQAALRSLTVAARLVPYARHRAASVSER